LAEAATDHNLPFILSTVTTSSIERIGALTNGRFWFQLYHPADDYLRDDLLHRAEQAGCKVLVLLCDVPVFGYRPRDIRNGLAMPPKISWRNLLQLFGKPAWAIRTLTHGKPEFATMKPYLPPGLTMAGLGEFMNKTFSGRLNEERIAVIRDRWRGALVLKGVVSQGDVKMAIRLGLDGVIVSNHGGRQLDAGESSIRSLQALGDYHHKIKIMMDSGLRSGPDIARALAAGACFTFLGRTFMYGVGALGDRGGWHSMRMLKIQLQQVMEQVGCATPEKLPEFRI
jgi:L-lactate dehydrogenase (cytochrome)